MTDAMHSISLRAYQKDWVNDKESRIRVAVAMRRSGMTVAEIWSVLEDCLTISGFQVVWVVPDFFDPDFLWTAFRNASLEPSAVSDVIVGRGFLEIVFMNRSKVKILKGHEPARLLDGLRCDRLVIDPANKVLSKSSPGLIPHLLNRTEKVSVIGTWDFETLKNESRFNELAFTIKEYPQLNTRCHVIDVETCARSGLRAELLEQSLEQMDAWENAMCGGLSCATPEKWVKTFLRCCTERDLRGVIETDERRLVLVKRIPGVRRNGQFWDEFLCEAIRKEIGSRKSMK